MNDTATIHCFVCGDTAKDTSTTNGVHWICDDCKADAAASPGSLTLSDLWAHPRLDPVVELLCAAMDTNSMFDHMPTDANGDAADDAAHSLLSYLLENLGVPSDVVGHAALEAAMAERRRLRDAANKAFDCAADHRSYARQLGVRDASSTVLELAQGKEQEAELLLRRSLAHKLTQD